MSDSATGRLVINMRRNRSLYIGDDVKMTFLETKGGQTKILVEAPRNIAVDREEVRAKKQRTEDELIAELQRS